MVQVAQFTAGCRYDRHVQLQLKLSNKTSVKKHRTLNSIEHQLIERIVSAIDIFKHRIIDAPPNIGPSLTHTL